MALAACAAVLVLAACAPEDDAGSPGSESEVAGQGAAGIGEVGGVDGPDAPVSADAQGSADLPTLPIGGSVSIDAVDTPACVVLAWSGEPLPGGAVARITALAPPAAVAVAADRICDGRPCLGGDSFRAGEDTCTVALSWDGTGSNGGEGLPLGASGLVVCERQQLCDQVASAAEAQGGTANIQLSLPTGSEESTDTPTSEGPSEWTDAPTSEGPSEWTDAPESQDPPEPQDSTEPLTDPEAGG
ncbi:hypothetical protein [Nocardioides insulae]|uniref:hypothetical protein n=1 Tax=Nocardioides insulae TaxID=394734 RepID=UPI0003F8B398|nr:hypothetical protein [Nocardioides insulae]